MKPHVNILIAESESHIRRLIRVNLERAGYGVTEASDGGAAWRLLQAEPFDLLLVNTSPLEMNLQTLLNLMEQEERWATMPVIVMKPLSNDDNLPQFRSSYSRGRFATIITPFNPENLKRLIQQMLP